MSGIRNPELGVAVAKWRKQRKMSQEALSEKCDFTKRYLMKIERGDSNPSYEIMKRITDALNISADELFYPNLPDEEKRVKMLMIQFRRCNDENQETVLRTMECLIHALLERQ